ncbi:MAG: PEGA domain-containing protein [Labilithrix sp.]|nr:PEGA domain-containing protein [Labilithrix sp.]
MMRSARRIALAVSITLVVPPILLSMPRTASAQAPKSIRDSLPLEARGHWDAGVALAQRKIWDGARTSFKAAYDLSKNPRVLFNLAVAEKELGRYAAALETFKRELAEGKGQLTPSEESDVKAAISGLERLVAEVTIDVSERDADVFIDNDKIDNAKLPGPITVQIGERRVRAVKPGFAEAVESIQLAGGAKGTVTLKLQPLVKTSRVNVSVVGPSNAVVKIDGKEVGPAPYAGQVVVTADPHQFSAEAPGYVTATQSAIVKDGEILNLTLQLAPEQEKGKLVVVAKPEGSTIEIDGKPVGATRWEGPVDARTHQVVVKKQGFYTWSYDVDVPKGGERSVSATLNEDRNTSFVPWLIGSLVVGAALTVGIVLLATPPDQQPVDGTLAPFKVGTQSAPGFSF